MNPEEEITCITEYAIQRNTTWNAVMIPSPSPPRFIFTPIGPTASNLFDNTEFHSFKFEARDDHQLSIINPA
jgi:hypothetical protein